MLKEYSSRLMDALEVLERGIFGINDLKREFEYRANKLVNQQALIACLILPLILITIYTINGSGLVGKSIAETSPTESFLRMFVASFVTVTLGIVLNVGFKFLWYQDYLPAGKTAKQQKLMPEFAKEVRPKIQEVEAVLNDEAVSHPKLPEEFINFNALDRIAQYEANGQADCFEEAVRLLKEEENPLLTQAQKEKLVHQYQELKNEEI
ncbi:hypothetical protein [Lactococcus termiticola]|uniref:Uncharacterized protein n=1 Tax=Lactococcus termiticola TaxID=2169526 RepID=A0A2R5HGJ6_9LACT|nr:hypothetical protein [Lactococcus termiticola]GBG97183.1 hypothetical protein NtB2_01321 [Lactococcus termiticola]